jgi:Rrf2 family iron-sulfur cluster assembly transcriptional regulator
MLGISKKTMITIEAVLDTAYNSGGRPIQGREISSRQGIPRRYLEPVLQELVRAGVLNGVRGPHGGYRLARERRQISLAEISDIVGRTEASSGPIDTPSSSRLGQEIIGPLCVDLADSWTKQLEKITIEDLVTRAFETGVDHAPSVKSHPTAPALGRSI